MIGKGPRSEEVRAALMARGGLVDDPGIVHAVVGHGRLVIADHHGQGTPAKNFYWCLHDALQKQGVTVKAESLSVPALVNEMEVNAVVTHLRQKYPEPPTAIVMIGDPGWIVCRELFDDVWKDVPVVVTNARDRRYPKALATGSDSIVQAEQLSAAEF